SRDLGDPRRDLERCESGSKKAAQLALADGVADHDGSGEILTQRRMGDGECGRFDHLRMLDQSGFDLARGDLCAAAIDDIGLPSRHVDESVAVDTADVARSEPTVAERRSVGPVVILVAVEYLRAADDDLARLVGAEQATGLVGDPDVDVGGETDRSWRRPCRRKRRLRNAARFGGAVT